jgi:hypothetical protein
LRHSDNFVFACRVRFRRHLNVTGIGSPGTVDGRRRLRDSEPRGDAAVGAVPSESCGLPLTAELSG